MILAAPLGRGLPGPTALRLPAGGGCTGPSGNATRPYYGAPESACAGHPAWAILGEDPPSLDSDSDVPDEFERILFKTLEKDPRSRYPSAAELHDDLAAFQQSVDEAKVGSLWGVLRRPRIAIPVLFSIVVITSLVAYSVIRSTKQASRQEWASFVRCHSVGCK